MTTLLAHPGLPPAPHDLWSAWNLELVPLLALPLAAWAYRRGYKAGRRSSLGLRRARCFAGALAAIGLALISPLDALSGALASAHMVQNVLLLLVAAPLLAFSDPFVTLLRGSPVLVRRAAGRWARRLRFSRKSIRRLQHPGTVWLAHVGALWFWHASIPYGAALESEIIHSLEHTAFLLTGILFWRVVIGPPASRPVSYGLGILLVFGAAMQSVFLSALLTFGEAPWYEAYLGTTWQWGLTPLADQQLAGVIMWVPAGLLYVAAALSLLVAWVRATETEDEPMVSLAPSQEEALIDLQRGS